MRLIFTNDPNRQKLFAQLSEKLFELTSDGILLVSPDGTILYMNDAYCKQIKIDQQTAIGMPVEHVITNTVIAERLKRKDFLPEHNVLWAVNPGQYASEEKYAVVSRQLIREPNGTTLGAVGQVKFIGETMELSQAIRKLNDALDYWKGETLRFGKKKYVFENIIGVSSLTVSAKDLAQKAAFNDFPVLITGESGTGKELFANAIHYAGARSEQPIVCVNCAAIPRELFESELFGYTEGAFTGAKRSGKKGKFELANHGTIFLDEIGDMPLTMQAKLLRVLQEGEVERVGGERPVPLDVRIIAATNKNLMDEVQVGRFRLDLFYRLNVVDLHISALRDRREDIPLLAESFLKEINQKYSSSARFASDVMSYLQGYHWPGNIRELHNVVERAYMLAEREEIRAEHFPLYFGRKEAALPSFDGQSLDALKEQFEQQVILEALRQCGGNVKKCADLLQVHRSTLYNKLKTYQADEYKG